MLYEVITEPPYTTAAQPKDTSSFMSAVKVLLKKPAYVHVVAGAAIASFAGYGIAQFSTSFLRRTHSYNFV